MDKRGGMFSIILRNIFNSFATFAPFALSKIEKVVAFVAIDKKRDLCGDIRNDSEKMLEYPYKA